MSVVLIRHGKTAGNLACRYIGCRTDEPLCEAGIAALKTGIYPMAERVFVSPMRRCLETAALLYPHIVPVIVPDFRECDFGRFEGRNYGELNRRKDYQAWIDSGGELPFPDGESRVDFAVRCVRAYQQLPPPPEETAWAVIAHGGTLMAIMEAFALPRRGYFDYQTANGGGYVLHADGSWERLPLQNHND